MTQGFSKKNQSSVESAYRFGDFELHPQERLLKSAGVAVPLQPKAFDALLCLVRRAEHLVSKEELIQTLWPSVHVSESNLTNTIVSLRKIVGRDAIRTVSKYGYRFDLPVTGEPGVARAAYEKFARAKELSAGRAWPKIQTSHLPGRGWVDAAGFWINSAAGLRPILRPMWSWRRRRSSGRLRSIRI
jgi:DNA-binding winged helix-turn-helix (wHTH) protein